MQLHIDPFSVSWSIEIEFYLYLLFPLLLLHMTGYKPLAAVILMCLSVRIGLFYLPPDRMRDFSYYTIFGALPVFALGVACGKARRWRLGRWRRPALAAVVLMLWGLANAISETGGFFGANVNSFDLVPLWLVYPEIVGIAFLLLVQVYDGEVVSYKPGPVGRAFSFLGKISYSGYMLHLFTLNFVNAVIITFHLPEPNRLLLFPAFLALLIPFSYLSFKVIEEPFLKLRPRYALTPTVIDTSRPAESRRAVA